MRIFNIKVNCIGEKIYKSGYLFIIALKSNQKTGKKPQKELLFKSIYISLKQNARVFTLKY